MKPAMDSLSYTFRRRLLDNSLNRHCAHLEEPVVEIGNGTRDRRGRYQPRQSKWFVVDIENSKRPNLLADGEQLPFHDQSVATVVALEVLEHVKRPEHFLKEIHRALKPNGEFLLSMPFLYRYHAAPHDFQRYTEPKLRTILAESGFSIEQLEYHGFYFTVMSEQIKSLLARIAPKWLRQLLGIMVLPFLWFLVFLDRTSWVAKSDFLTSYTTGFFVVARKA